MTRLLVLLALVGASSPVAASALEPKKASELVTLLPQDVCDGGNGFRLSVRVSPDGSIVPFSIPQGHVLVVTRWGFVFNGGTGASTAASLLVEGASTSQLAVTYLPLDSSGNGGATLELSAVVGAGATLCSRGSGVNASGTFVEGFLTKAK